MTPLTKLSLYAIGVISLMNAIWMVSGGFGFAFADLARTIVSVTILLAISFFYTYSRPVEDFAVVTLWTAILIGFSAAAAVSSYLFTSLGYPLQDSSFAAFDEAIGFDWLAALSWANQYPLLGKFSTFFYSSSLPLIALTLIYLAFTGRAKQLELFITSLIFACVITLVASGPLAALGPYVYYKPTLELYQNFAPAVMPHGADSPYISHFLALRDGSMKMLALGSTEGLIVFPSFHTVMSVLMILALRGCGPMFWLGGLFNVLILTTVPLDGGHYLADMVAGIVVAVLVWAALFKLQSEWQPGARKDDAPYRVPAMVFGPS